MGQDSETTARAALSTDGGRPAGLWEVPELPVAFFFFVRHFVWEFLSRHGRDGPLGCDQALHVGHLRRCRNTSSLAGWAVKVDHSSSVSVEVVACCGSNYRSSGATARVTAAGAASPDPRAPAASASLAHRVAGQVFLAGLAVFGWQIMAPTGHRASVDVTVPELSETAAAGQSLFAANCAACNGRNAASSDNGPPLVHPIYNPGHHSDMAFYNTVRHGSRQHHWAFGDMPAQPQLSTDDTTMIIDYVRELQVANGIAFDEHRM